MSTKGDSDSLSKLVVFDWDDSLYPTSVLSNHSIKSQLNETDKLFKLIHNLLLQYIRVFGSDNIVIVTHGKENCILKSLQRLIKLSSNKTPYINICKLIQNIKLISSQYLQSSLYPRKSYLWKYFSFKKLFLNHFIDYNLNRNCSSCMIISIGDSITEYKASSNAAKPLSVYYKKNVILHRIKLKSKPSITNMIHQITILSSLCKELHENHSSIDIEPHTEYELENNEKNKSEYVKSDDIINSIRKCLV